MKANWHAMDAGPALDRQVAEALGFHLIYYQSLGGGIGAMLADADGGDYGGLLNGENYWLPHEDPWAQVPPFSRDLNAAITLVEDDYDFTLDRSAVDEWHVRVHQTYFAVAPTPELAICRAWLAWKAGQS